MPEVIMPKMGDAMEEGTLIQWLKQDGETVKVGDLIAEIETDKSNVEVPADDAGVLHIHVQPGTVVPVGKAIATIGEDAPAPAVSAPASAPKALTAPAPAASPAKASNGSNGTSRLKASPLARSVAKLRGVDIAQVKGTGPQGRIIEADVLAFAVSAPTAASAPPSTAVQSDLPTCPANARRAAEAGQTRRPLRSRPRRTCPPCGRSSPGAWSRARPRSRTSTLPPK